MSIGFLTQSHGFRLTGTWGLPPSYAASRPSLLSQASLPLTGVLAFNAPSSRKPSLSLPLLCAQKGGFTDMVAPPS